MPLFLRPLAVTMFFLHAYFVAWSQTVAMWAEVALLQPKVETNTFSWIPKLKQNEGFTWQLATQTWVFFISLKAESAARMRSRDTLDCYRLYHALSTYIHLDPSFSMQHQNTTPFSLYQFVKRPTHRCRLLSTDHRSNGYGFVSVCSIRFKYTHPPLRIGRKRILPENPKHFVFFELQHGTQHHTTFFRSPTIYLNQPNCHTRHLSGVFWWHIRTI